MLQLNSFYFSNEKLVEVLEQIGVEVMYQTSSDLVAYCPFHVNRDSPAFNVSKIKDGYPWKCHNGKCAKSGKNLISLFKLKGFDEHEIKSIIKFNINNDQFITNLIESLNEKEEVNEWDGIDPAKFRIDDEDCGYPAKSYLQGRGINEDAYNFFGMGFSAKKRMLVIPVYDEINKFVGVIGRNIETKRYQYSYGLQRKSLVWNLNRARRNAESNELILTEGALDAIYLWQAGFQNVGAVFGSSISQDQLAIMRRYFTGITCFFDNDDAGRALTDSIVETVHDLSVNVVRYENDANDPGDLSASEIHHMMRRKLTGVDILLGR